MLGLTDKATIEELTRRTEASLTERKEELSDLKLRAEELELEIAALRGDDVLSPTSVPSPKGANLAALYLQVDKNGNGSGKQLQLFGGQQIDK